MREVKKKVKEKKSQGENKKNKNYTTSIIIDCHSICM